MGTLDAERSVRARMRSDDPHVQRYADMPAIERELAKQAQIVSGLAAIHNAIQDMQFSVVHREQNELPFRIEEKGFCDVHDGSLNIQPQTSGLEEIRTILVTCKSVVPALLTITLDPEHIVYLTAGALTTSFVSLAQQELLVHSATRHITWTPGSAGNQINFTITGRALPQLKGRKAVQ